MNKEIKEYLEKKLVELTEQFKENQDKGRVLLNQRNILTKSINTINNSMEDLVKNGSIIMAKNEAINSMLKE